MAQKDYYQILGVSRDADANTIKKAYRKLAMKYHPDVNKEAGAEERFKEINEAYGALSDPEKKALYDQYGTIDEQEIQAKKFQEQYSYGAGGAGGFGGFSFDDLFGGGGFGSGGFGGFGGGFADNPYGHYSYQQQRPAGPIRGQDIQAQLLVSFKEAALGETKTIRIQVEEPCSVCGGTGAKHAGDVHECKTCHGTGTVFEQNPGGIGASQRVCPDCHGTGKTVDEACDACNGRGYVNKTVTLDVKIPQGIPSGKKFRLKGKGEPGLNGGEQGDLIVQVEVQDDPVFIREGNDITCTVTIPYLDAVLGGKTDVPTLDGEVLLTIPAGVQPGQKLRLKGKGITWQNQTGDEYVAFKILIPKSMTEEDRELYERIRELGKEDDGSKAE